MSSDIELSQLPSRQPSQSKIEHPLSYDQEEEVNEFVTHHVLPPVDGGRKAWSFLAGATVVEMLVWGFPYSIGILHVYWTNTLFKGYGESMVTLAATLQTGLLYMSCAVFGPLFTKWPKWQKTFQYIGLFAASLSLIGSAFASKPWHLIVTIGCIYSFAGALYLPCCTLLFEWFVAKRGLANGAMFAGTGVGGVAYPYIMSGLLNRFGYKTAMISLGVGYAILGTISLIPVNRRVPVSRHDFVGPGRKRPIHLAFLKSMPAIVGPLIILLVSLGNFIPTLWLPSYVDDLEMRRIDGTALIAILNAASVPGNTLLGYFSDYSLRAVIVVSCVGSALGCAFLWGFGMNPGVLIVFAIIYGLLGTSFQALWSNMIGVISKDDPIAPPLVFSIFAFMRGIGNITSGPISGALLKHDTFPNGAGVYGFHNYGALLLYTAITIFSGGVAGILFK
ncbi:monocarboxylic acid transporter [Cryptococcus neoformans C23]|uniref:Monocarboxylic acid transporter n=1 Tax=Cryptococcus neoformans (strain H99 / ATCC 208821 / CBS 10515 / FGSC 9487) TaxID=235443 RepID=J9VMW5_CRYN9|nr:monocarboxylic acid transporter [Cryptococcus neoformans var. grubii H99]AFR95822.1 monocarboxylic acid transporter [Cryptococcus neoformans var. grubii H99]AUB25672.1 monocarboxylic acid transporter [Cryptococcus neoformans var. grubii]OWZ42893.1 monocarboxylic acid transporter [Cryptococcus neoformans var. grubii C23]OXG40252.1 monocarboxylic acid transporter [Cryptococcus neoformans var. grubii Bt15]|eukprot:XP_012050675.1 monocarboxylic acid transporter [Cryptococcus neoformans var. grubii H99]